MAEALKDRYNKSFILNVGENMKAAYVQFSIEHFDKDIFTAEWELYELKDRMYHISKVLKKHLPNDFKSACDILIDFVKNKLEHDQSGMNFEHMFLGDFVEKNGLSDFKTSFKTMEEITKFSSCEFAIRPFIIKDQNATFKQLSKWANSKHPMVRRLSTEGCRPLLPWAMKLPRLVVDPKPILDILNVLKDDENEAVRKSVANNINDISKNHKGLVADLAAKWYGHSEETDKVIKHGLRTLLKEGNPKALSIFGYADSKTLILSDYIINNKTVVFGSPLSFNFSVQNKANKTAKLRLEYALHFLRKNGQHNKKVFMLSERQLEPGEKVSIKRSHPFKPISTRKYYDGPQYLELIVNGVSKGKDTFNLEGS